VLQRTARLAAVTKWALLGSLVAAVAAGCGNNPYPREERRKNYLYRSFDRVPKTFDPASSYSSDEYEFICQIYEPPLQYHYLQRPGGSYMLVPLTATEVPQPHGDPPVYDIHIRKGILYQPHPCFARDRDGGLKYHNLKPQDVAGFRQVADFRDVTKHDTRELVAADYAYQIRRMADPSLKKPCPILELLSKYIVGMAELHGALKKDLAQERARRSAAAGAAYNQELDERKRPILLDLLAHPLPGVEVIGRYHLRIRLRSPYPQFKYWLAMPFFAPMPPEAVRFYAQPAVAARDMTLTRFPVGTGPFYLSELLPNRHVILRRNENFWGETYPAPPPEGQRDANDNADIDAGLYRDAGETMPFIERAVYKYEPQSIPYWQKFLQGYYDASGILSETFDQAVQFTEHGVEETKMLREKDIRLITSASPTTYYLGFNMLDDVVGTPPEFKDAAKERQREMWLARNRKLRLAISIAMDWKSYIDVFLSGRGVPAQGPLPPGIFGYEEGKAGVNPYVSRWDDQKKTAVLLDIEEAKKLMVEAGYPDGKDPSTGRPLALYFDTYRTSPEDNEHVEWMKGQLKQIGIDLRARPTNYNQFQEKMQEGTAQLFMWGWHADYPDPENFLFLLYSGQGKVEHDGENASNYSSPAFDRLFLELETMDNTPGRLRLIRQAVDVARRDAPWVWAFHPVGYGLYHQWYRNIKPLTIGQNSLKYRRLDPKLRAARRAEWNVPVLWPLYALLATVVATISWVVVSLRLRRHRVARRQGEGRGAR